MNESIGKINFYNSFKGFGFIRRERGKDVYFSIDDIDVSFDLIEVGMNVKFEVIKEKKGPKAIGIQLLD